ncbi:hypothetical protein P856_626 [Candidatus Endolissoclinum faulkneri L5]|uniref:GmrSD restriction endonucleases C-terminal domain-containing protein n=1 Tax=Candidatus Endolissoclinum faulkneri L5 TaxID=1401328 RepID=V9TUL0_9PROT|nr:DUF1524 domain-containing protein [Candidatus Endolissoclinum faulkneri]AHC73837.1 hypothetical protein P856_626 [Candidatus Endolissoclinum faulkneri L5]
MNQIHSHNLLAMSRRQAKPRKFIKYQRTRFWKPRKGKIIRSAAMIIGIIVALTSGSKKFNPIHKQFDRALYRHWSDFDKDCRDTRQEVLISESLKTPVLSRDGCKVISGKWYDPFNGKSFNDPSDLDIDHLVPLSEAHRSGASRWNASRREAYANDLSHPDTLIAIDKKTNRSKGDSDPLSWMPPKLSYWCQYVANWRATKKRWKLKEDLLESLWINIVIKSCSLKDTHNKIMMVLRSYLD